MDHKELLLSALFFDSVKDSIGREAFELHKDIIVDITAAVLDEWRGNGKGPEELFEMDEMLMLVDTVCAAQELMDTLMIYARKG